MIFIKLLLAHLVADFLLQPKKWVLHKQAHKIGSKFLYFHIGLHMALSFLVLWDLSYWKLVLVLGGLHYLIDLGKLYVDPHIKNSLVPFVVDQLLHILAIYTVVQYPNIWEPVRAFFKEVDWPMVTSVVFLSLPAAIIMGKVLEPMSDQIPIDHRSLPNAGKYIGIIERLFVFVFVVTGRWEGIGLLITAKSVFRFNDLKESNNRKWTEYILIGTLLSFGMALATGLMYLKWG